MNWTIEVKEGHHIVDMAPKSDPVEFAFEILKLMTGYKAVEIFADALQEKRDEK